MYLGRVSEKTYRLGGDSVDHGQSSGRRQCDRRSGNRGFYQSHCQLLRAGDPGSPPLPLGSVWCPVWQDWPEQPGISESIRHADNQLISDYLSSLYSIVLRVFRQKIRKCVIECIGKLFVFCFLGPPLQHMQVPRLGVKWELQPLVYTTARATRDSRHICDPHHSSWLCWILNPLSEARDGTSILMDPSWVRLC